MKVRVDDNEAVKAVRPLDLAAYLRARGWREFNDDDDGPASSWFLDEDGDATEVLLPKRSAFSDYAVRVRELLHVLGEVERRSELQILRDIAEVSSDVVRLRAFSQRAGDGTLPLQDALRATAAARGMLLAAACAAEKPRRAYHSRKSATATRYLDGCRLGQSERGSYVLTIVSPVGPVIASKQQQFANPEFEADPVEVPFARKVTETLVVGLGKLRWAAERAASTGEFSAFEESVAYGVSADLCEALALVGEGESLSHIDISVAWAPSRPTRRELSRSTAFSRDFFEVVGEAGRILREREPIEDYELFGPVITIQRPGSNVFGTASVVTLVDGKPRRVEVDLWGDQWTRAHEAIEKRAEGAVLRCIGELVKEGRSYKLRTPRDVQVISMKELEKKD